MIYTPTEYSQSFKIAGKKVSEKTVIRRCMKNMLPRGHKARRLHGRIWAIEVKEDSKTN